MQANRLFRAGKRGTPAASAAVCASSAPTPQWRVSFPFIARAGRSLSPWGRRIFLTTRRTSLCSAAWKSARAGGFFFLVRRSLHLTVGPAHWLVCVLRCRNVLTLLPPVRRPPWRTYRAHAFLDSLHGL
ncbi:hypothetical protein MRX96_005698 [Rhipicephalus microplus]